MKTDWTIVRCIALMSSLLGACHPSTPTRFEQLPGSQTHVTFANNLTPPAIN